MKITAFEDFKFDSSHENASYIVEVSVRCYGLNKIKVLMKTNVSLDEIKFTEEEE